MLDSPATDPPSMSVATYTLRDVPESRCFAMMRDMMGDGHKPFMRALLTVTREDGEAPYDGSFEVRTTGELICAENFSEAAIYSRTPRGVATTPIEVYGLQLQVEGVSHFTQGGQTRTHEPGSLMLMDSNVPFITFKAGRSRHRSISHTSPAARRPDRSRLAEQRHPL